MDDWLGLPTISGNYLLSLFGNLLSILSCALLSEAWGNLVIALWWQQSFPAQVLISVHGYILNANSSCTSLQELWLMPDVTVQPVMWIPWLPKALAPQSALRRQL